MDKLNYIFPIASFILGLLGYERLLKKDSNKSTTDMAILMTKVDMLLTNSNNITQDIKEHSKLINEHEVKIKDIKEILEKGVNK